MVFTSPDEAILVFPSGCTIQTTHAFPPRSPMQFNLG